MKGIREYSSFICKICAQLFGSENKAISHVIRTHGQFHLPETSLLHYCKLCDKPISRIDTKFVKHFKQSHSHLLRKCRLCEKRYLFKHELTQHLLKDHSSDIFSSSKFEVIQGPNPNDVIKQRAIYFRPYAEKSIIAAIKYTQRPKILRECIEFVIPDTSNIQYGKFMLCAHAFFIKYNEDGDIGDQKVIPMSTGHRIITISDLQNSDDFFDWIAFKIEDCKDKLEMVNSGWSFQYLSGIDLEFIRLTSVGGCLSDRTEDYKCISLFGKVKSARIEKRVKDRLNETLLDFSNDSEQTCFFTCIAAALCKKQGLLKELQTLAQQKLVVNTFKVQHFGAYMKLKKYASPFPVKKVKSLEKDKSLSRFNLAVNVFTCHEGKIWPLHISSCEHRGIERINLLLLQPEFSRTESYGHYVLIDNLELFVNLMRGTQWLKERCRRERKLHVCPLCFTTTSSQSEFKSHKKACLNGNRQIIEFPRANTEEALIAFDYSSNKCKEAPFIGFLDFEAKMSPVSNQQNAQLFNCENCKIGGSISECQHSERLLHEQNPMTFSLYFISTHDNAIVFHKTYSSDTDVMSTFYSTLQEVNKFLSDRLNSYKTLHWSPRLEEIFSKEKVCYICKAEFLSGHKDYGKVRDHCHMSPPKIVNGILESKFLGAAHNICNRSRQLQAKYPIYVHNLMSYDANFFFDYSDHLYSQDVKGIPYNGNKLRCITIDHFQFLDSYQILAASLSELADALAKDAGQYDFSILKQAQLCADKDLSLLLRKSVYPYEWVRSVSQLKNEVSFPSHDAFFSSLKGDTISQEDFLHGQNVYNRLNCQNMLEYTELYCKLDTLLLAEIVLSFRELIWSHFKIPIENYISTPQITWDACLKTINRPIEVMTNATNIVTIESAIRGGVSFVNNRHEKIQDPNLDCLLYLDATNLYGFAQQMPLPIGGYANVPLKVASKLNWRKMTVDQSHGYILEVDLEIPKHLHSYFDNLPIAPSHDVITYEKLSSYSQNICNILRGEKTAKKKADQKLTSTVEKKERYMVHYLNLGFYLRHGAQLKNIHSCISFRQEAYLKPYIDLLSKLRAEARSEFKKRLFKLLANSLYGKFIQDVRKYCEIKFAFSEKQLQKYCKNPFFVSTQSIGKNKNVHMVFIRKPKIKLNRLYAVGFSILELSKLHMFSLWYEELFSTFGEDLHLVLTDTDSFIMRVNNHSKTEALSKIAHIMDFSNYPPSHPLYNECVKKVPGYLKDEYPNANIEEVVAVKSKCYFLKLDKAKNHVVCKGIAKRVSDTFPIELYRQCVYDNDVIVRSSMTAIRAKKHKLRTVEVTKVCMSSGDDKRYQTCAIHSVPYGSINSGINEDCRKCILKRKRESQNDTSQQL